MKLLWSNRIWEIGIYIPLISFSLPDSRRQVPLKTRNRAYGESYGVTPNVLKTRSAEDVPMVNYHYDDVMYLMTQQFHGSGTDPN